MGRGKFSSHHHSSSHPARHEGRHETRRPRHGAVDRRRDHGDLGSEAQAMVLGPHAIEALVTRAPKRIREVLIAGEHQALRELLRGAGIRVRSCERAELSAMSGAESHQGVVGVVAPRDLESLDHLVERLASRERALVVMLDSINDPHNFGACLRACECFGVDAVIFSKNRGSPLTATVSKTSVGASELVSIVQVSNLAQAQSRLGEEAGFESVATAIEARAANVWQFSYPAKTLLILGAEGQGVQPLLLKKSEHVIYIPMMGVVDSLNVSQALAVTLAERRAQEARAG